MRAGGEQFDRHGGDEEDGACPVLLDHPGEAPGGEAAEGEHGGVGADRVGQHPLPGVGADGEGVREGVGVGEGLALAAPAVAEVGVRRGNTLGAPGGSRGVEDLRRVAGRGQRAAARRFRFRGGELAGPQHQGRTAVVEHRVGVGAAQLVRPLAPAAPAAAVA